MKKQTCLFAVLVTIVDIEISLVKGYSTGAIPLSRCNDMTPQHRHLPSPPNLNTYSLYVPFLTYLPGSNVHLTLRDEDHDNPQPFVGYYVQGRSLEGNQPIGRFNVSNFNLSRTHSCPSNITDTHANTLSHTNHWHLNPKAKLTLNWTAPFFDNDLYFTGTFVQSFSTFWTGTSSLTLSPLHRMNFTECCGKESQISSSLMLICAQLADQDFLLDNPTQESVSEILADERERHGFFLVLRCLHWSTSSSPMTRNNLRECCTEGGVEKHCLIFCDGETYATWDRYQWFFESFHNCSMNNEALLPCHLYYPPPDENEDLSSTSEYPDSTENPTGCPGAETNPSSCPCESGFTSSELGCVDINECELDVCGSGGSCLNSVGSFSCFCLSGFTGDGFSCSDINECASDPCGIGASCVNSVGSFSCFCLFGYTGDGFTCTAENKDVITTTTPFHPTTSKSSDFETAGTPPNCLGIGTNPSDCSCESGFTSSEFGCIDVDECSSPTEICSPQATCTNTVGSFTCACNTGWTGNGTTCIVLQPQATDSPTVSTTSPFQLQNNSILYLIVTTINFTPTSDRHKTSLNNELEQNLLAPALGTIDGYQRVRFVNGTIRSFIITSEAEFTATTTGDGIAIPTLSMIENSLEERALALNHSLPGPTSKVVTVDVNPEFKVTRQATNGLCNEETACPIPPAGYSTSCVEVGLSSIHCFCVLADDDEEMNCATTGPLSDEGLSVSLIVGIAIGGLVLLIVLTIIIVCYKRRHNVHSNKRQESTKLQVYHGYVDPATLDTKKTDGIEADNGDAVYMEIHPKEEPLYTKDGEYLDMDAIFQTTNKDVHSTNESQKQSKILQDDIGYETPIKQQPPLPGNHPSRAVGNSYVKLGGEKDYNQPETQHTKDKSLLTMEENSDGYLISIQHNPSENFKDKSDVIEQSDQPSASTANYEAVVYRTNKTEQPAEDAFVTESIVTENIGSIAPQPIAENEDVAAAHTSEDVSSQEASN